ncbi:MAG: hypothetical protein RLZZ165_1563 [Bacteroidota bacterium]|jgi:hypothetical protein
MDIHPDTAQRVVEPRDALTGGQAFGMDLKASCRTFHAPLGAGKKVFSRAQAQRPNVAVRIFIKGHSLPTFLAVREKLPPVIQGHLNGRAHYNTL